MAFDIAKALKNRVILLSGDEELLRRRGLQDLLDGAGIEPDGFDTEVFEGGDSSPMTWIAACGTAPFLGDRRVALVRHVLRCDLDKGKQEAERAKGDHLKPLIESLKGLPETALLILVADEEAGDDEKQRKADNARTKWNKFVKSVGGVVEEFHVKSEDVRKLLKEEASKSGLKVSEAALATLTEMCGGSFSRSCEELEKLFLYTHGAKSIQESDVRALVVPSREWNVFKLVDAIVGGQVGDALHQLRTLVGSQNKAEDAAIRSIFPNVSRNLKLLWQGRMLVEARCSPATVTPEVQSRLPEKPNILNERDWIQRKSLNSARNVSFKQISRAFGVLALTDARMKGIEPGFSSMDSLERMALEMVEIFRRR